MYYKMSLLLHGNCLDEMKGIDDNSIDFIFCDLPYGQTSCKWDCKIDLEKFWLEIMRIKKINTPIFMTTTTKFGVELIQSAPKKCPFRYDLVWVKSAPAGFLSAKKMPMRKHEMVYVFYEKLPLYDLSSHKHKFIDKDVAVEAKDGAYGKLNIKQPKTSVSRYDPALPDSVVKEDCYQKNKTDDSLRDGYRNKKYEPPLPNSVIKEDLCKYDVNKNAYGGGKEGRIKISKDKKDHQQKYDPPLPTSVVKEEKSQISKPKDKDLYGDMKGGTIGAVHGVNYDPPLPVSVVKHELVEGYEPRLPTSMLEIKSTRGKHSTEKPVALIEWLLKYYSKEGDVVLDPTMGSGSTGVACKNMNRNFIGIELDPEIYEVAVNRIEP